MDRQKSNKDAFIAPPTPAVSPPRHEDGFDDSNLIFGPATPYIPGVSEPEPVIPLRDHELTLNSTPKFNTPLVPESRIVTPSDSNRVVSQDTRNTLGISPVMSQTVTGNNMSVNMRNNETSQSEVHINLQNTAQQHLMPPPLKRCPPRSISTTHSSHQSYPILADTLNTTNAQSFATTRNMPQTPLSFISHVNQVQTTGHPTNCQARNGVHNSQTTTQWNEQQWRYHAQSQSQRIAPAPSSSSSGPQATFRHPHFSYMNLNVSTQSRMDPLHMHQQQSSVRPMMRSPTPIQNTGHCVSQYFTSTNQTSSYTSNTVANLNPTVQVQHRQYEAVNKGLASLAQQLMNQMSLSPQDAKEFKESQDQIWELWNRNPTGIRNYLRGIMKNPGETKWNSWYYYYHAIATTKSLGSTDIEKDTIRWGSQVANTIKAISTEHIESQERIMLTNALNRPGNYSKNYHIRNRLDIVPTQRNTSTKWTNQHPPNVYGQAPEECYYQQARISLQQRQNDQTVSRTPNTHKPPPPYYSVNTTTRNDPRPSTSTLTSDTHAHDKSKSISAPSVTIPSTENRELGYSGLDLASPPAGYSASAFFSQLPKSATSVINEKSSSSVLSATVVSNFQQTVALTVSQSFNQSISHAKTTDTLIHSTATATTCEVPPSRSTPPRQTQDETTVNSSKKASVSRVSVPEVLTKTNELSTRSSLPTLNGENISLLCLPNKLPEKAEEVVIIRKKHHQPPPNFKNSNFSTTNSARINVTTSSSTNNVGRSNIVRIEERNTVNGEKDVQSIIPPSSIFPNRLKQNNKTDVKQITEGLPNTSQNVKDDKELSTKRLSDDTILGDTNPSEAKRMKFSRNITEGTRSPTNQIILASSPISIGELRVMSTITNRPNEKTKNCKIPSLSLEVTSTTTQKEGNGEFSPLRKVVANNNHHMNEEAGTIEISQSKSNIILKDTISLAKTTAPPTETLLACSNIIQNSWSVTPILVEGKSDCSSSMSEDAREIRSLENNLERPNDNISPDGDVRKNSYDLFKNLFGKKKRKSEKEKKEEKVTCKLSDLPYNCHNDKSPGTNAIFQLSLKQKALLAEVKPIFSIQSLETSQRKNIGVPYQTIFNFLDQLICQSMTRKELNAQIILEIHSFLNSITCNKNAPEVFMTHLSQIFARFQSEKLWPVSTEQQKKLVRYLDELRIISIESFTKMRLNLKKRHTSLFFEPLPSNIPPRNMPQIGTTVPKKPIIKPSSCESTQNSSVSRNISTPNKRTLQNPKKIKFKECDVKPANLQSKGSISCKGKPVSDVSNNNSISKDATSFECVSPKKARTELFENKNTAKCTKTIPAKQVSIPTPPTRNDFHEIDKSPTASNVSFFHKDKHQTQYFLLEYGQLCIPMLPYQKRFLLNTVPLGYRMVLMTNNKQLITNELLSGSGKDPPNPDNYFMLLAHQSLIGESISGNVGAVIRCAIKDELALDGEQELRFCIPTLTDVQVVDCLDYNERQDAAKVLWHVFHKAQECKERGIFIKFQQYAEICLHVEQKYHYRFPQQYYPRLNPSMFLKLMEAIVWGQVKKDYQFRRQNVIRFKNSELEWIVLVFNKNVFFVPANLWINVIQFDYKDAIFGEDCHEARLLKKGKKSVFKISFRKDSPILLEAEALQDTSCSLLLVQQKIKEGKPFCAIRGDQFAELNLPAYHISKRENDHLADYRMYRKVVAKGHIKAKKKGIIKDFTIVYLDFYDEDESKEVILEPNSNTEMIGRSITMLIIPENCQSQVENFNLASDRIVMTRPSADDGIWMLTDIDTTPRSSNTYQKFLNTTNKVIRSRFITNLRCDHNIDGGIKCRCSKCAKERLKNNFTTDLLFLSSDLLHDFLRQYEILEWKNERRENVYLPPFRTMHPNLWHDIDPNVLKSAEEFQIASSNSATDGVVEKYHTLTSSTTNIQATKSSSNVPKSIAGHSILKNLVNPVLRRHSISDNPSDVDILKGMKNIENKLGSRSISLIDSASNKNLDYVDTANVKTVDANTKVLHFTKHRSEQDKEIGKRTSETIDKKLTLDGRSNPTPSHKNQDTFKNHHSVPPFKIKLNNLTKIMKPSYKKPIPHLERNVKTLHSNHDKISCLKNKSSVKPFSNGATNITPSVPTMPTRTKSLVMLPDDTKEKYERDSKQKLNHQNNDPEYRRFLKYGKHRRKNDNDSTTVVIKEVPSKTQSLPRIDDNIEESGRAQQSSFIKYPISTIKNQRHSPNLVRAKRNIFRSLSDICKPNECYGPAVMLSSVNKSRFFEVNGIDLARQLTVVITKETQNLAHKELLKQNRNKGIITPSEIQSGIRIENFDAMQNERRNSSDSDSGVDVSVEVVAVKPPPLIKLPIKCNLCDEEEYQSREGLWLHQIEKHMEKDCTEENVFPIENNRKNNYYSCEVNVGPDLCKFDETEGLKEEKSKTMSAWVCFECVPPMILTEEKFNNHADNFMHFEDVKHFENMEDANADIRGKSMIT